MEDRTIGIIGGIVLFLALLSPLVIENRGKIDRLYSEAETSYDRGDYMDAIEKYTAAHKESKKLFTKTNHIDKDFKTHINIRIARCYYDLGNSTQDKKFYWKSLNIVDESLNKAKENKHIGELLFIKGIIYYIDGKFDVALSNLLEVEKLHLNFEWYDENIYTIGDIYYQQEKYDQALVYFHRLKRDSLNSEYNNQAKKRIDEINSIVDGNKNDKPNEEPEPEKPSIPEWEKEVKRKLDRTDKLKQLKNFNEAMEQYDSIIKQYPKSQFLTNAYEGKGDIYSSVNNYLEARANYEEAIYSTADEIRRSTLYQKYHNTFPPPEPVPLPQPKPLYELWTEAIRLVKLDRFHEAAVIFEKFVDLEKTYADKSDAYLKASNCYYRVYEQDESQFDASVDALRRLIDNYTENEFSIQAYYYLAKLYLKQAYIDHPVKTKFHSVISIVQEAKEKFSGSEDILTQDLLEQLVKFEGMAMKNINNKPNQELPIPSEPIPVKPEIKLVNQGYIDFENKELNKALEKAREALRINPKYQRAIQLRSDIRDHYFKNGTNNLDKNDFTEAVNDFKRVINIDQNSAYAYCNLGVAYIYMEKYDDAIRVLKFAQMRNKIIKEVYFNLALAYYELKKYNEANREIKKALEIDPKYTNAGILMDSIDKELKEN